MKIILLSDAETQGGAAIAASRLAVSLHESGHQVIRLVHQPDKENHYWETIQLDKKVFFFWRKIMRRLSNSIGTKNDKIIVAKDLSIILGHLQPDVINFHNLHGAAHFGWTVDLLDTASRYAPVVWTLHDMWSFTGRCAYNYTCRRFETGCNSSCPTPDEYPELPPQKIARVWNDRYKTLLRHMDVVAVTPSAWLASEARLGMWKSHPVEVIPNGLPLRIYDSLDRSLARRALQIEPEGPVLLVASESLADRRKGMALFLESLKFIAQRPLTILTMGNSNLVINIPGIKVYPLGYISHERTKALVFNAADIFIHAAIADNLPNVVVESLACGTPVIGFSIGGMPEMVRENATGWLALDISALSLAKTINLALKRIENKNALRDTSRAIAEAEYGDDLMAQRYSALFYSMKSNATSHF